MGQILENLHLIFWLSKINTVQSEKNAPSSLGQQHYIIKFKHDTKLLSFTSTCKLGCYYYTINKNFSWSFEPLVINSIR